VILPTRHISPECSLLGLGSLLLGHLENETTVSRLWERVRTSERVGGFERFVLALDFLHAVGAVELREGMLRRTHP